MSDCLYRWPKRWAPYIAGAGIGVLSWITFAWMGKALGTSTTMVSAAGGVECLLAPGHVAENAYFGKYLGTPEAPKPVVDWQFALVLALMAGSWLSAMLARRGGEPKFVEHVPDLWSWRFGPSKVLRYAAAFFGGLVLIIGARAAGGCTSGHAISGGLQLAVSSWTFLIGMFVSGVVVAFGLFGKEGRNRVA